MASADYARLLLFTTLLGSSFGLACNGGSEAVLETYGEGAAEDYGCIVGDLGCECASGDLCDGALICQQDLCVCNVPECMGPPPTTGSGETVGDGDGDSGDGDGDSGDGDGDSGDGDGDPTTTGDGDGDPTTTGDGDGDPTTTGDGDGDPTTTGDGDGDPTTTGDGDGDPTGDGDGDPP